MWKRRLRNKLCYAGVSKTKYTKISNAIQKRNALILRVSTLAGLLAMIGLLIASLKVEMLERNRLLYLSVLCGMIILFIISKTILNKYLEVTIYCSYLFLVLAYGFALVLGVINLTVYPATTFMVLLLALPLLIIDKPYRISVFVMLITVGFCIASAGHKEYEVAFLDITNAISVAIVSIIINYFILKERVRDLYNQYIVEKERNTDDLTNLLTKVAAQRKIKEYITNNSETAAMVVLDIDGFKQVNDTLGHAYGDAVLIIMGQCIRKTFRMEDILGRFGGDEFVIFLPDIKSPEIAENRIKELVKQMSSSLASHENSVKITGSIGVAMYPEDAQDYEELFKLADKALYQSKGRGKNCYTFYFDENQVIERR